MLLDRYLSGGIYKTRPDYLATGLGLLFHASGGIEGSGACPSHTSSKQIKN